MPATREHDFARIDLANENLTFSPKLMIDCSTL